MPFFLCAGTALASGRGEEVLSLPDIEARRLVLAWPRDPPLAGKTARMYAALRPEHYSDGSLTDRLARRLRRGEAVRDGDVHNAFEKVLPAVFPEAARLFDSVASAGLGRPHLVGSGPAIFLLLEEGQVAEPVLGTLRSLGLETVETRTLSAPEATAWTEG